MQTGCKVLLPRYMAVDYDISRPEVIVESWKVGLVDYNKLFSLRNA